MAAKPVVGNILDCLRPDFHRQLLEWSDTYGGIYRLKFLWQVGTGDGGVLAEWPRASSSLICLEECVSVPACQPVPGTPAEVTVGAEMSRIERHKGQGSGG